MNSAAYQESVENWLSPEYSGSMVTERRTHVIIENEEADATIVSDGRAWVRLKRMRNIQSVLPCEFQKFEDFDQFVEALLQIRAMVRSELIVLGEPKAVA